MHKIKEKLMEILDEYEDRARNNPDGRLSDMEIQKIHMLTDTVKNICNSHFSTQCEKHPTIRWGVS